MTHHDPNPAWFFQGFLQISQLRKEGGLWCESPCWRVGGNCLQYSTQYNFAYFALFSCYAWNQSFLEICMIENTCSKNLFQFYTEPMRVLELPRGNVFLDGPKMNEWIKPAMHLHMDKCLSITNPATGFGFVTTPPLNMKWIILV